jgi:hypothetical protein
VLYPFGVGLIFLDSTENNMPSLFESCISQHGETARAHINQAIALGEMCLLPNVGFDPELQDIIDGLLQQQNPSESGIRDIKVFAKSPRFTAFDRNVIQLPDVVKFFDFGKQLYAQEIAKMEVYDQLDEYWNESKIYRRAKDINLSEFNTWMNAIFAEDPDEEEPLNPDRREKVSKLIGILSPHLFTDSKPHISMYCTTEDNNENTSFAPYFFIGDRGVVIIAKRWIL